MEDESRYKLPTLIFISFNVKRGVMIEKISYSQLNTYEKCPELWYKQYIEGVKGERTEPLQFGENVHNMLAVFLASGDLEHSLRIDENCFSLSKDKNKACFLACNLVKAGINLLFSEFTIRDYSQSQIEQHLESVLDFDLPLYQGYIDFWFVDNSGNVHIVDWKTSSRIYNEHDIATSEQLTGYMYLLWKVFNIKANHIHYIVLNKYTSEASLYSSCRTLDDLVCFEDKVKFLARQMLNQVRFKRPAGCIQDWNGRQYKCDFYNECWKSKVILPADDMLKFAKI